MGLFSGAGNHRTSRQNLGESLYCAPKRGDVLSAGREEGNSGSGGSMRNLGVFWVVYGFLRFAGAIGLFVYSATLTLMYGALLNRVPNPFALMGLFHGFLIFAIILSIVAGIVSVIAGLGLMSGGQSARGIGLVAAFLGLINGPLGIALGAYTLVVLVPVNARNS
jgi:hypothetical protein